MKNLKKACKTCEKNNKEFHIDDFGTCSEILHLVLGLHK